MITRFQVFQICLAYDQHGDSIVHFNLRGEPFTNPTDGINLIKDLTELEPDNSFTQIAVYKGD